MSPEGWEQVALSLPCRAAIFKVPRCQPSSRQPKAVRDPFLDSAYIIKASEHTLEWILVTGSGMTIVLTVGLERVFYRSLNPKCANHPLTIHSRPRATPWHPCNTIFQSHRQPIKHRTCLLHGQNRLIGMDHEKGSPDSACFGCFWFRF